MKKILIIDFGSQFTQLIATRIRGLHAYSEICNPENALEKIDEDTKGIIFSGGPNSVYEEGAPTIDKKIFDLNIPILGVCYGHHLIAHVLGGKVERGKIHEFGRSVFEVKKPVGVFANFPEKSVMWMSHGDEISELPEGFEIAGSTDSCPIAATMNLDKKIFTIQFHAEVVHSEKGNQFLQNFVDYCGLTNTWQIENFIDLISAETKEQVGDKNVFLMVSGGVDSTVVFALLNKVLGAERVFGLFVDTGLLRLDEAKKVSLMLKEAGFNNLHIAYEEERFLARLKEKYEPEEKREIIGNTFLDVQAEVATELELNPEEWFLAQGTIFPDTIETGGSTHSQKIKTHHNRVERIQNLIEEGKLVEPLKMLFKDEVRELGRLLNLPEEIVARHPFPGPGLGVRILCAKEPAPLANSLELEQKFQEKYGYGFQILPIRSVGVQGDGRTYAHPVVLYSENFDQEKFDQIATEIPNQNRAINRVLFCLSSAKKLSEPKVDNLYITKERADKLRIVDDIIHQIMRENDLEQKIWQFPVVLAPLDFTEGEVVILRPIESVDAMTAISARIPFAILQKMSQEIQKQVPAISAIFYDLTSKPPGTIEWE